MAEVTGMVPDMMLALAAWWAPLFLYRTYRPKSLDRLRPLEAEFRERGWLT